MKKKYDLEAALEELEPNILKDSERLYQLKLNLQSLNQTYRTVLLLYLELGSMAKVGKVLNVSPSTVFIYISKIRKILMENH